MTDPTPTLMHTAETVDLLVVGGGVAGAAAAIAAADRGAHVVIVEKTGSLGGNCRYSSGNLLDVVGSDAMAHLEALCFGKTEQAVLASYLAGLNDLRTWLERLGADLADTTSTVAQCWPHLPGADGVIYYATRGDQGPGPELWARLEDALRSRPITVLADTTVAALLQDGDQITGAVLQGAGGVRTELEARFGVVLCTGGFENAPDLCDAYLPVASVRAISHPGNTGDGLRLAQSVGASVWHMPNFFGFWCLSTDDHEVAFGLNFADPGHLIVGADGRRFAAETGRETHDRLRALGDILPSSPNYPQLPVYAILDERAVQAGPVSRFHTPNVYQWSHHNEREIAAGWITRADTAEGLANAFDIEPAGLAASIVAFNAAAAEGHDREFGRSPETMRPLAAGPLYGIRIWPGVATTSGGPRRDHKARVLDAVGHPIPGLYAAGGNGSVWGHLTQHGGGLTDGLVFGQIAAQDALRHYAAGLDHDPVGATGAALL
jgi:succinate dehydrogenase/fumarate reductase flavoprotein subunit